MKLRHIHDLSALRADLWCGDLSLVGRLCGTGATTARNYLTGICSPSNAKGKLVWRVLLAKIINNRAFLIEWQSFTKEEGLISSEQLAFSAKLLFTNDKSGIDKLLGLRKQHCGRFLSRRKTEGYRRILTKVQPLARAVVLRAKHNEHFLAQVDLWLSEKTHGDTK